MNFEQSIAPGSGQNKGIRRKTEEELRQQASAAQAELASLERESGDPAELIPPSVAEDIFSMSIDELKEKYPKRWLLYTRVLRGRLESREDQLEAQRELKAIKALNNLDRLAESELELEHEGDPRAAMQAEVYRATSEFLESGGTEGYIKLPTGAGKTVVFSKMADALGLRTLIVVPNKNLVGQTVDELEEFAPGREVGVVYSDEKKDFDKELTVTTYQSLVPALESGGFKPEDYGLLVLDEAHRSLSEGRSEAAAAFAGSLRIGFTATPKFSEERDVAKVLNHEIYRLDVKEAAERGILSPFRCLFVKTGVKLDGVKMTQGEDGPDYDAADLQRAVNVAARNKKAVDLYKEGFDGKTAVAYCAGVEHAKDLAAMLNESGVAAEAIHGGTSAEDRKAIFARYKSGETKVLCNADLLIEGFNEPRAEVCLNLRPTASKVAAEQRAGRVLRLDRSNPGKVAIVIDFLDEYPTSVEPPVTFPEIVGKAVVWKKEGRKGEEADGPEEDADGEDKLPLPKIDLEGVEIVSSASEMMEIVRQRESKENRRPPKGWVSEATAIKRIGRPSGEVRDLLALLKRERPEERGVFENAAGAEKEYYAPELIEAATRALESAPDGSVLLEKVEQAASVRLQEAEYGEWRRKFDEILAAHPEWKFRRYAYGGNGRLMAIDYLRPEAQKDPRFAALQPGMARESAEASIERLAKEYADLLKEEAEAERDAAESKEAFTPDTDVRARLQRLVKELVLAGHYPRIEMGEAEAVALLTGSDTFDPASLARKPVLYVVPPELKPGKVLLELLAKPDQVTLSPTRGKAYRGEVSVRGAIPRDQIRLYRPRPAAAP